MYDYSKLFIKLDKKKINKSQLTDLLGVSARTIAKFSKGEEVGDIVLNKIAKLLNCEAKDLYIEVASNPILKVLKEEKKHKISGGLYHELQIRMTYNSNHIEGNSLSLEQTRYIYETKTIDSMGDNTLVDDIIETSNHFRCIDFCIDHAEDDLDEEFIKKLHYLLKQSTLDSSLDWFNVGEYKAKPNVVGGFGTVKPKDVSKKISQLLKTYLNKKNITIEDIIDFHYNFETIHPFQDGNGRVGRLIAFKECLKHNIIPFIIEDSKEAFYYRGLSKYREGEKGWLIDTCLDGQDTFKEILKMFEI